MAGASVSAPSRARTLHVSFMTFPFRRKCPRWLERSLEPRKIEWTSDRRRGSCGRRCVPGWIRRPCLGDPCAVEPADRRENGRGLRRDAERSERMIDVSARRDARCAGRETPRAIARSAGWRGLRAATRMRRFRAERTAGAIAASAGARLGGCGTGRCVAEQAAHRHFLPRERAPLQRRNRGAYREQQAESAEPSADARAALHRENDPTRGGHVCPGGVMYEVSAPKAACPSRTRGFVRWGRRPPRGR